MGGSPCSDGLKLDDGSPASRTTSRASKCVVLAVRPRAMAPKRPSACRLKARERTAVQTPLSIAGVDQTCLVEPDVRDSEVSVRASQQWSRPNRTTSATAARLSA
jgi:hypothetical protein